MQATALEAIRDSVAEVMRVRKVPGIVVGFAVGDSPPRYLALGEDARERPLEIDTVFTVASITKLATALAVLRLVDDGRINLDAPLHEALADATAAQEGVTVRSLLSHSSGLAKDLPRGAVRHERGLDWPTLARACLATPLEAPPATRVQYSNVGYGLVAVLVERATSTSFTAALDDLVLQPLGIEAWLGEAPIPVAHLGGTHGEHSGTELEPFNSAFWRELALPWGGLLTHAEGVLRIIGAFQGRPADFLLSETRADAVANQNGDLGGGLAPPLVWPRAPWGLGPELRDAKAPHWAPAEASPNSYGHAGASGCFVWADPRADVAWAILGAHTADNGWLIRGAPKIGAAILAAPHGPRRRAS
jgi:CubicO group peptidase (beta-lactamase class C family)